MRTKTAALVLCATTVMLSLVKCVTHEKMPKPGYLGFPGLALSRKVKNAGL